MGGEDDMNLFTGSSGLLRSILAHLHVAWLSRRVGVQDPTDGIFLQVHGPVR